MYVASVDALCARQDSLIVFSIRAFCGPGRSARRAVRFVEGQVPVPPVLRLITCFVRRVAEPSVDRPVSAWVHLRITAVSQARGAAGPVTVGGPRTTPHNPGPGGSYDPHHSPAAGR